MKKFDLLKILGIAFAITLLLSWVIPAGAYSSGVFASVSKTVTIGLYDIVRIPAITFATFIQYGVVFLAIGGFYGVLNKTGVFSKVVNTVSESWKINKKAFLLMTIFGFALLSSLIAIPTILFILVPLFVAILLSLGYNKMTTFAATIGAILVGQIGAILGFNLWGYLAVFLSIGMTALIGVRIALFLIATILFMFIVIKHDDTKKVKKAKKVAKITKGKKVTKEELKEEKVIKEDKIEIPLMDEITTKKSITPFIVIFSIMLVVLVLGMYNWYYAFNTSAFTNLHEAITTYAIGGYTIFAHLLGNVSEFGFWGNYDLVVILVLTSLLLGWIYNVKFDSILDGFKNGMKKIAPAAFYAMLASVLFTVILNMSDGTFVATIIAKILGMTDGFNFLTATLSSVVSAFYYNDFYTLVSTFYATFALYDASVLPLVSFIVAAIYGLVMVIAPTSIFLLAGLKYMEIPYKDWAKYIWKFLLIMLAVIILISFLITLFI